MKQYILFTEQELDDMLHGEEIMHRPSLTKGETLYFMCKEHFVDKEKEVPPASYKPDRLKGDQNMRKYDMRICSCGRIHMIPMEKIDNSIKNNKNFLYICGGCGKATIIGADIEQDWYEEDKLCYNMYSGKVFEYKDGSINVEDFSEHDNKKAISEIFYSHGIRVPMMTGEYARSYCYDQFADMWYPNFYEIQRNNVTLEEVKKFVDEFTKNQVVVNMNRFIRETPEEYLEEISRYISKAFDWTGTKYERR